jgi:hypothetical protein
MPLQVQTPEQCDFMNESLLAYARERNEELQFEDNGFDVANETVYGNVTIVSGNAEDASIDQSQNLYGSGMSVPDRSATQRGKPPPMLNEEEMNAGFDAGDEHLYENLDV